MANPSFFKPTFDALAVYGCIGDPNGKLAYGYLRVSGKQQSEDGRSGLPRQIEHIHEAALQHSYRVPWELIFADDHSGFEFDDRPQLTKLRKEIKSRQRKADVVFIEHLDRLSRNSDWHQGFLLDEFKKAGVEAIFWKAIHSRIERAVIGAIAQEGMEQAFERQTEGTRKKAQRGCITAKTPAFGYKLVDQQGREGTKEAREHTQYALDEGRAFAIRYMFHAIAYHGKSSYELLKEVDEKAKTDSRFRPPHAKAWNERSFVKMLRNPLYKGEYIANRHYIEKVTTFDTNGLPKTVRKSRERPESEWITVAVPAIVDTETWELANKNLFRNKGFAKRNKVNEYFLTDIICCATCGRRYHGHTENKPNRIQRYTCATMHMRPAVREHRPCGQPTIRCDVIDTAVWQIISAALLRPEVIVAAIDAAYSNAQVDSVRDQIAFLEREIPAKDDEESKFKKAYLAEAYSAEEFAAERKRLMRERDTLRAELEQLRAQVMTPEELAAKKESMKRMIEEVRTHINMNDVPFLLKRQIMRLLLDEVRVNVAEGWFEIKGTLGTGIYRLIDGENDSGSDSGDKGSAHSKPLMSAKSTSQSGVAVSSCVETGREM
ncbi:MAG: recombinase family protein [Chloroflexota bacterium]